MPRASNYGRSACPAAVEEAEVCGEWEPSGWAAVGQENPLGSVGDHFAAYAFVVNEMPGAERDLHMDNCDVGCPWDASHYRNADRD